MSSGQFTNTKYQLDSGAIAKIRVQPETLAFTAGSAANTAPSGAVDRNQFAKVGGSRRTYGIHARGLRVRFVTPPTDYAAGTDIFIPVLTSANYATYLNSATGTYLGQSVTIVGYTPERVK